MMQVKNDEDLNWDVCGGVDFRNGEAFEETC